MITIRRLVQNISKGQAGVSIKYIIKGLDAQYNDIKSRIKLVHVAQDDNETGTYCYLSIPSESKQRLYYDVVFWINSNTKMNLDTEVKVYSNSPSFAYNFTYLFHKEGSLLYPELYPQSFLTMSPKVRNPYGLFGFDKHVYYGVKTISKIRLDLAPSHYNGLKAPKILSFIQKKKEIDNK